MTEDEKITLYFATDDSIHVCRVALEREEAIALARKQVEAFGSKSVEVFALNVRVSDVLLEIGRGFFSGGLTSRERTRIGTVVQDIRSDLKEAQP